jgi:hypothetical protein
MVEGLDELRLELEDHPTLLIRWGSPVRTTEGLGRLLILGILVGSTADEFACRMEFIVYDSREKKNHIDMGKLIAFAISRRLDPMGKNETACIITNDQVTTIFRYEQEALSNHADRWFEELARSGYPGISVR